MKTIHLLPLLPVLLAAPARAALFDNLVAYYDFEESGAPGLANKAPGATDYNATRFGGGTFNATANPSGPGFAGNASFTDGGGTSDRSHLLAGNALNLVDNRNDAIVVPLGSTQLGQSFSISAWHALTPLSNNNSVRYHVFETAETNVYDVSWGTTAGNPATPQATYNYLGYIGTTAQNPNLQTNAVTTGEWHHVVHTFTSDGTNTTLTIHLDGKRMGSQTVASSLVSFAALHFGRARNGTDDRDWDGMLDEIAIWNRPLTALDINELYARGRAGFAANADLGAANKAYVGAVTADPTQGAVTGSGVYDLGSTAPIVSTPAIGFAFFTWDGDFLGQPGTFNHTVAGDVRSIAMFQPNTADTDGDGLTDFDEINTHHTNPNLNDSDGDGIPDGTEVAIGTPAGTSNAKVVSYILNHLCSGGATGDNRDLLFRDTHAGTVRFRVSLQESTDLVSWQPLSMATLNATYAGDTLEVALPASATPSRFYRFTGGNP